MNEFSFEQQASFIACKPITTNNSYAYSCSVSRKFQRKLTHDSSLSSRRDFSRNRAFVRQMEFISCSVLRVIRINIERIKVFWFRNWKNKLKFALQRVWKLVYTSLFDWEIKWVTMKIRILSLPFFIPNFKEVNARLCLLAVTRFFVNCYTFVQKSVTMFCTA